MRASSSTSSRGNTGSLASGRSRSSSRMRMARSSLETPRPPASSTTLSARAGAVIESQPRPVSARCYGKEESTQTFSDPAGDQRSTADTTSIKVIEYCEGAIGIELTLSGPPELTTNGPLIALDLDQNPDTGSAFDGTEVEFVYGPDTEGGPGFYRADGWDFRRAKRVPWMLFVGIRRAQAVPRLQPQSAGTEAQRRF